MKQILRNMRKGQKRGSIIVEFLVVLPVFVLLIWAITQLMLFLMAHNTLNEAAIEGARVMAMEMRGKEGAFPDDASIQEVMQVKLASKMEAVSEFNKFILLFHNQEGYKSDPNFRFMTTMNGSEHDACIAHIKAHSRAVCSYVKSKPVKGTAYSDKRFQEQVVVMVGSEFKVLGSFIPGLSSLKIEAIGISQKELSDRYQYYAPDAP